MFFAITMNNCKETKAGCAMYITLVNTLGKGTCRVIRIQLLQGFAKLVYLKDGRKKKLSIYMILSSLWYNSSRFVSLINYTDIRLALYLGIEKATTQDIIEAILRNHFSGIYDRIARICSLQCEVSI